MLKAWLVPSPGAVRACFVAAATDRAPASAYFPTAAEAQAWVEREAREIGAWVQWIEPPE